MISWSMISRLISPPVCAWCYRYVHERTVFCVTCKEHVRPVEPVYFPELACTVYAATAYVPPVQALIHAKYQSRISAGVQLAQLIWEYTPLSELTYDFIVPVPLYITRLMRRGFNQSAVIADTLARMNDKPVLHALRRNRATAYQTLVSRKRRAANVQDAFMLCADVQSKHVLIVDDLLTTGATLQQALSVIKQGNPASVQAVVACRVRH